MYLVTVYVYIATRQCTCGEENKRNNSFSFSFSVIICCCLAIIHNAVNIHKMHWFLYYVSTLTMFGRPDLQSVKTVLLDPFLPTKHLKKETEQIITFLSGHFEMQV